MPIPTINKIKVEYTMILNILSLIGRPGLKFKQKMSQRLNLRHLTLVLRQSGF